MEKLIKFYIVKEKMEPIRFVKMGLSTHQMAKQRITELL